MAYYKRGEASLNRGQYRRAIIDLDQAINLDPEYANAYGARAVASSLLGEDAKSEEDLSRAVELGVDKGFLEGEMERLKGLS